MHRGRYRNINHPSIGEVGCQYCGASKGSPCRKRGYNWGRYAETHKVRADDHAKMLVAKEKYGPLLAKLSSEIEQDKQDLARLRSGSSRTSSFDSIEGTDIIIKRTQVTTKERLYRLILLGAFN